MAELTLQQVVKSKEQCREERQNDRRNDWTISTISLSSFVFLPTCMLYLYLSHAVFLIISGQFACMITKSL